MAGADPNAQSNMITGINVTPLVDITLVLLIVFMVTATYIVKATIDVELPRAATGGEDVGKTLNVVVKQPTGAADKAMQACTELAVDGAVIDELGLIAALRTSVVADPNTKAMISAATDDKPCIWCINARYRNVGKFYMLRLTRESASLPIILEGL